jgi:hypothetical protein
MNMQKFYGIAVNDENLCEYVVGELCAKGTLTRLLERDRINLDWNFKSALMKDLTNVGVSCAECLSLSLFATQSLPSHRRE